jgi:uncharacterized protein YyaL (SSP411 family)
MAHESFEDEEVARLMNETFVSVKVDREERPDVDAAYMTACQIMTGSGGWPLTVIMTPEKKPFFAATYIPKKSRYGRVGMLDLIPRVKHLWENQREKALSTAEDLTGYLEKLSTPAPGEAIGRPAVDNAFEQLSGMFDTSHGGFARVPKFPTPHNLLFLLRYWRRTDNGRALSMVEKTLQEMRLGGIFDHIGFGFHRYSTDEKWRVPHFEKMLYDQALLAMAYAEAFQATKKDVYKETAQEILTYVLRDMQSQEGGFYSAEDADSEGVEGKFYTWTLDEIEELLGEDEAEPVIKVFNVKKDGNFLEEATKERTGKNILHLKKPLSEISKELGVPLGQLKSRLEAARKKLFLAREKRIHPGRDEKILVDWNGLMIAALAIAARAFDEEKYADAARKAADFTLAKMRDSNGRLLHRYKDGEAKVKGFIEDYAYLVWGLIELYETTFDEKYLIQALSLTDKMIEHFWDSEAGGFFFNPDDGEELLVRKKEIYDGAHPSGNSVAMHNLLRLSRIAANPELEERAINIGRAFSKTVKHSPAAYTQLMSAIDLMAGPSYEVVIVGDLQKNDTRAMIKTLRSEYIPNKVVLLKQSYETGSEITKIAEFISEHKTIDGKATAYVCSNYSCKKPTTEPEEMMGQLKTS